MNKKLIAAVAVASSISFAASAQAATESASFDVVLAIGDSCTIATQDGATEVNFGAVGTGDGIVVPEQSMGIEVTCSQDLAYTLSVAGAQDDDAGTPMTSLLVGASGGQLPYTLSWAATGSGTGTNSAKVHTLNVNVADINAATDALASEVYSDTVTVTVTF